MFQNVIIGISGGIAAYKIPILVRLLKKNKTDVKVVVTQNSLQFVTKLSLETLSENTIYSDVFSNSEEYKTGHISITDNADCMIVAPATANIIAKFASGIADDALSTTFLSFNKDIFIAPSMNSKMWDNPATVQNIQILRSRGVHIIEPLTGYLACGYDGKGRMAEPEEIFNFVKNFYSEKQIFHGKKVLLTAGPTYEPIDSVRFISNYSSGKMGFALAEDFAEKGAEVFLISGPVNLNCKHPNIKRVNVTTAAEMEQQCKKFFPDSDITVMAAAVADYTPSAPVDKKLKKSDNHLTLSLIPTNDILSQLGYTKTEKQVLGGFALETDNEEANALDKLESKKLDFIVLNSLRTPNAGFGYDTNKVIIFSHLAPFQTELKTKREIAKDITTFIYNTFILKK